MADAQIGEVRDLILETVRNRDADIGSRRVLIKRLPGMEDSSRHWSVFMTLDHLRIVNLAVAETVRSLGEGIVPERKASTADVKPSPDADSAVVSAFEDSCDQVLSSARGVGDLRTEARFAHPWFGGLDAAGWHFMAPFHMRLHLRQIDSILRALGPAANPIPVAGVA